MGQRNSHTQECIRLCSKSEVGKGLSTIVETVGKVTDLINRIAKASEEQSQGVDQINVAVPQIDKVTKPNAAGTEESDSAPEEMNSQTEVLQSMLAEFTLNNSGRTLNFRISRDQGRTDFPADHQSTHQIRQARVGAHPKSANQALNEKYRGADATGSCRGIGG